MLFLLDAILIQIKGVGVDWTGYGVTCAIGIGAIAIGQLYRTMRLEEKIALATTASGLFILFTISCSIFNYLLLPVGDRRIDPFLIKLDAMLHYSWPEAVVYVASLPWLASLLRFIYMSSLPQLIVILIILGFLGQRERLHQFLLTGVFGALMAIAFWAVFPSSGPSAFEILPAEVARSFVVGAAYGTELNRLALDGPSFLSPKDALGLIAFPSFHTVMACMAVWFMAQTKRVFPLFLIVNILMLPAILVHGGHHLVDVFAGFIVFGLALMATRMLPVSTSRLEQEATVRVP
ncbi:phosphatase PAP2 family protein [Phyllobacterium sp. A18/5-2]|uniref:phosphatase PAP2 family protein n=1 Tax=Phyllobacterium sp. A18/5-2 TaxID=2978392 RepID=UPI0021CA37B1|nr:phosphatase PAP2 family protein [Phyllobacterium sp. A18/5-2]UXN65920.1 phosphatase PAP2 family protein [Phyllobacterium sp. A18/5-2]